MSGKLPVGEKPEVRKPPAIELFSRLGVGVKEGKNVGLYGLPMIGKSVLAAILVREFVGENGTAIVFGTEDHYSDEDYRGLIASFLPKSHYINYCRNVEEVYRYLNIVEAKQFEGRVALILDSFSALANVEASELSAKGLKEVRLKVSRVTPMVNEVATRFKRVLTEKHALGITVMHASSMAGAGKFRGLVDWKPVMSARVAHSLDYLIYMHAPEGTALNAPRALTMVASRLTPLDEGRTIKFRFKEKTVEILEGEER